MNTKLLAKLLNETKDSGELHQKHVATLLSLLSEQDQNKLLNHFNNNLVMIELSVSFPYKSLDKLRETDLNDTDKLYELLKTTVPTRVEIAVSSTLMNICSLRLVKGVATIDLLINLTSLPTAYINYRSTPSYTYIDITGVITNLVQSNINH